MGFFSCSWRFLDFFFVLGWFAMFLFSRVKFMTAHRGLEKEEYFIANKQKGGSRQTLIVFIRPPFQGLLISYKILDS